jgi:hypothetical protein
MKDEYLRRIFFQEIAIPGDGNDEKYLKNP